MDLANGMLQRVGASQSARQASRLFASSTTPPKHTPLYDWHTKHGGALTDFSGWMLPQQCVAPFSTGLHCCLLIST